MQDYRAYKHWDVESKETKNGTRYRYRCTCGHTGRWLVNPNDADGDNHLYYVHGEGE